MRLSKLVSKTTRQNPAGEAFVNSQLLIRAGYINKEMAGVYSYLPLGLKVLNNIIDVIRDEMNKLGAQELLMSGLQDPVPWQATGQWSDKVVDVWFKTHLKSGQEVGLSYTHEAALTNLMKRFIESHKDLPQYIYQFQTKFRNELRAKSGILRTREFIMKDLYSFSRNQAEHQKFYDEAKNAYTRIFNRLGIGDKTYVTFASGGTFSQYSHEFQTECPAGEDTIFVNDESKLAINKDVLNDEVLAELGLKRDQLRETTAAEVGNIFSLGTTYSKPLELNYTDEKGKRQPVIMGSYGIGPGRVMGVITELFSDERGLAWPENIAPFSFHLAVLGNDGAVIKRADDIYQKLVKAGKSVLYDDREVSPGQKLSEADLLGMPTRLVVSQKTGDKIELKSRQSDKTELVTIESLL